MISNLGRIIFRQNNRTQPAVKNDSVSKSFCLLFFTLLAVLLGCSRQEPTALDKVPERIISLAPDITETVYALGLGDKLVGATTACSYPEAAKEIPRVGGFGQFNFEAIVSLKPDVVILHDNYESEKDRLDGLGIPYVAIKTRSMKNIMASFSMIGIACGAEDEADQLLSEIQVRLTAHTRKNAQHPRVLITFGGDAGNLDQIHAFGTECLHNELLKVIGAENVVQNGLPFSILSKEAVIRLNPEIIIQLAPGTKAPVDPSAAWKNIPGISAVKNNRIYVLTDDYTCIPGPRFIQILDDFAKIIRQNDLEAE